MPTEIGKIVLIIEDNEFMAQLLSEKITHRGFTPTFAQDGTLGIANIEKQSPHLVVVDIPLSGTLDGYATISEIRKKKTAEELPILALFTAENKDDIKRAQQLGINGFLIKGNVNADEIVTKISEILIGIIPKAPTPESPVPTTPSDTAPKKPADGSGMDSTAFALREEVDKMIKLPEAQISIIKLVDDMMAYGYTARASDIHLEPYEEKLVARMRIDGILNDIFIFPRSLHSGIITRIKVLGGMRTDEHQAAQDGRFRMNLASPAIQFDVRVSIVPTYYGENCVLRLLAEQAGISTLDALALTDADRKKIRKAVQTPYGMILATGPTGSGKTTTLYTILKELNTREVSVITIEDPIEYSLEGIDQIQVNARTGLTFANGLRSVLRQDPNIIMVGEIRDEEAAAIAINAALTGHKLLSTIHTNDAATTLPRLLDMGIEPFLVASTINVAIGQRLVRTICTSCKIPRRITEGEFNALKENIPVEILDNHRDFFQGKGCAICHNTGYRGRLGIYEVLEMNDFIREAMMRRADAGEIKKIAIKNGMTTLLEDGFQKAVAGLTTIEEILRVIHE